MPVKIRNLTPHQVALEWVDDRGEVHCTSWESEGVARVSEVDAGAWPTDLDVEWPYGGEAVMPVCRVAVALRSRGDVEGLPEPQPGTVYLVSGAVLAALSGARPDCFAPDTSRGAVRSEDGRVESVTRLLQLVP